MSTNSFGKVSFSKKNSSQSCLTYILSFMLLPIFHVRIYQIMKFLYIFCKVLSYSICTKKNSSQSCLTYIFSFMLLPIFHVRIYQIMKFLYIFCKVLNYSICTDGWTDSHQEPNSHFTEICIGPDIVHSVIYSMEQSPSKETNMFCVVKKFREIYRNRKLIIAVTIARNLSLS